jgi:hypothetical protein
VYECHADTAMRINCPKYFAATALAVIFAGLTAFLNGQALTSDTVLIHVRVQNSKKEPALGLTPDNFEVREDGVGQKISSFSTAGDPWDIHFILLSPGKQPSRVSVTEEIADRIGAAYIAFKKAGNPSSKYSFEALPDGIAGDRELITTIIRNLDELKKSSNPRRALIVVTGSMDDGLGSVIDDEQVRLFKQGRVEDSNIQIYFLFLNLPRLASPGSESAASDVSARSTASQYSITTKGSVLIGIASKTRGEYYSVTPAKIESQLLQLAMDMKTDYVLGFKSTNGAKDNTWRKLKIKVTSSDKNLDAKFKEKYFVQKQ